MSPTQRRRHVVGDTSETVVGSRIRLTFTTDAYSHLEPGIEGTVRFVDHLGTVHVDWDTGSKLGLIPGEDQWDVIA